MNQVPTIACLTGSGTAPELMAEALYALEAVGRVHGFTIDQVHAPFGGGAFTQAGQTVPPSTRDAVLGADAVLIAGADDPALDEVMAELDLRARVTRVRFGRGDDVVFFTAVHDSTSEWAIRRAFEAAEVRRLRLACVGDSEWCELVEMAALDHEHVRVEHVSPKDAIPFSAFDPAQVLTRSRRPTAGWPRRSIRICTPTRRSPLAIDLTRRASSCFTSPSLGSSPTPLAAGIDARRGILDRRQRLL